MGSSLDSPGPITKTVEDSAFILNIIAGKDEMDATTSPSDTDNYVKAIDKNEKLVIGISDEYFNGVDPEVAKV